MSLARGLLILSAVAFPALAAAQAVRNDTGLPTYPHLKTAEINDWNLKHKDLYHVYKSSTADKYAAVVAWYKGQLPKAVAGDKDPGIEMETKLMVGKNIVNIYDLHQFGEDGVEIDLMKYKGAAPGA